MTFPVVVMLVLAPVLIAVISWFTINSKESTPPPAEATEGFIDTWLRNENGTIATYIQQGESEDEDLVKGRESLAETLGLWMTYAVEKEDKDLFMQAYNQLRKYFLEEDGFVNWKVTESGSSEVTANAFIDDIRIAAALVKADEKWGNERYTETARKINRYLNDHNVRGGIFTDYYERKEGYASNFITLSYIDGEAMELLVKEGGLNQEAAETTTSVLREAPMENGFYPKTYNAVNKKYRYDQEVNIVDQAIMAYHHAKMGDRSEPFLSFIREEMEARGAVHGIYDKETRKPLVEYESPAVYGFLILYCLEIEENALATDIYEQMKEFQESKQRSDYYGGYGVYNKDTHIFDNLVPLLAEEKMMKQ